jgi:hypothetical protein
LRKKAIVAFVFCFDILDKDHNGDSFLGQQTGREQRPFDEHHKLVYLWILCHLSVPSAWYSPAQGENMA